jgi:hypothetical protein
VNANEEHSVNGTPETSAESIATEIEKKHASDQQLIRIEQKIDFIQNFLNNNYRELEETLQKQKSYFNALEIMFYILLGISITQFVFLLLY